MVFISGLFQFLDSLIFWIVSIFVFGPVFLGFFLCSLSTHLVSSEAKQAQEQPEQKSTSQPLELELIIGLSPSEKE